MKDTAISDIIAAVLLIGVVTASLGIFGVLLTRDVIPEKIPQFNFQTCINTTNATISLYHTGGDTLFSTGENDEFIVNLLDKNKQSLERAPLPFHKGSWAIGESITLIPGLNPSLLSQVMYLQIISKNGRGEHLVSWAQVNDCSP